MLGTIVNTGAILAGSSLGTFFSKGISDAKKRILYQALGLSAFAIGVTSLVRGMTNSNEPVLFIASMVIGGLVGQTLNLEDRVQALGDKVSKNSGSKLIEGLTTAVLLFCIGTLSILGPIESALNGDNTLLFTNAMLDGITSMILASTFGVGIMLSAGILFLWQGSIYLLAGFLGAFASPELLTEISIVGGILIMSTGINILEIKKISTLNLIPALLVPVAYFAIRSFIG
jgi:hypothetical protein